MRGSPEKPGPKRVAIRGAETPMGSGGLESMWHKIMPFFSERVTC